MYLGAKIRKVVLENEVESWATSAQKYVQEAVSNSGDYLHEHFGDQEFTKKITNPFQLEYDPLMDLSAQLGPILLNYTQTHFGLLRLMVEFGRIEIINEVSMLASQLALPREVCLEEVFLFSDI